MATRGTGKTYEKILAEENSAGKKTYDEAAAKTKETAAQKISNQNAVIDSAAQNTTAQYQKTIDEAPKKFAGQYDDNYIDELVARKNLENTMADMGLTDSGLNRSQQTAISVMRGNADSQTRAQQQNYVTAAQQAIDQVLAQAEQDKASYANEVNASTDDYLAQLWASLMQNAQANATSRFNAQEESLDAAYKAQLEAEAEAEKRAQEWSKALLSQGYTVDNSGNIVALPKDTASDRLKLQYGLIETLVKEGVSYEDAVAMVMGDTEQKKNDVATDDVALPTGTQDGTILPTAGIDGVISGGYNSIGAWAEQNLAKNINNSTISKENAAASLYAQILDTYKVEPHKKYTTQEMLKMTPEEAQAGENALKALWSTAYDLGIEDEMAELCEVPLSSVPTKYTGGRKKTTSSGTVSSKGTKLTASTAATKAAASNKDDGGVLDWFGNFWSTLTNSDKRGR